jgi:hypothetical protein
VVKAGSGFIEWLTVIPHITMNSYDDPAGEISEEQCIRYLRCRNAET